MNGCFRSTPSQLLCHPPPACRSIVGFCQRYDRLERAAAAAGHMVGHPGLLAVQDKALMAPGDTVLLIAYLDMLT